MRNHPAERARQIEAVRRAGHDPALGTWPRDPGGPSAEARLRPDNPEGILPPEITTPPDRLVVLDEKGPDPSVLELEARAHENIARFFRKEARRLLDRATGLRRRAAVIRRASRSRG